MDVLASPFGYLVFEWNKDALGVTADGSQERGAVTTLDIRRKAHVTSSRTFAARQLKKWLSGEADALLEIPVLQSGTAFKQEVWRSMRLVPSGTVVSYAELAAQTSSPAAVRAAATACATNQIPIIVPCHRIIRSDGLLGNYAMGSNLKMTLLRHEGVVIA